MAGDITAENGASAADLAALCKACGICCDGSIFGRVRLDRDEVERARRHRLPVVRNAKSFEQPCVALTNIDSSRSDRVCSIYDDRPRSCRRFTCLLYERYRTEGGQVDERIAIVRRARKLLARVGATGLTLDQFENIDEAERREKDESLETGRRYDEEWESVQDAYRELAQSLEENFARAPRDE